MTKSLIQILYIGIGIVPNGIPFGVRPGFAAFHHAYGTHNQVPNGIIFCNFFNRLVIFHQRSARLWRYRRHHRHRRKVHRRAVVIRGRCRWHKTCIANWRRKGDDVVRCRAVEGRDSDRLWNGDGRKCDFIAVLQRLRYAKVATHVALSAALRTVLDTNLPTFLSSLGQLSRYVFRVWEADLFLDYKSLRVELFFRV